MSARTHSNVKSVARSSGSDSLKNGSSLQVSRWMGFAARLQNGATSAFTRIRADERGTITIMAAFLLPLMVGAMALGVEISFRYQQRLKIQHAADVAAHGAAVRAAYEDPSSVYSAIGRGLAIDSSWDPAGTYVLNEPPTLGTYAGSATGPNGGRLIEVILTETQPRLFSRIYRKDDITLTALAVAEIQVARRACVLALDESASRAMEFSGDSSLTLTGCDIASNSNAADSVYQGGSSTVTADCINASGLVDESGGITLMDCAGLLENQSKVHDPYSGLPDIDENQISCTSWNSIAGGNPNRPITVSPFEPYIEGAWSAPAMRFCNQDVFMRQRITFEPGIYILDGVDMQVNAEAMVTGVDVLFFLTNGATLKINGTGQLQLSAMKSGPFEPALFYVDRDNPPATQQLNGDSNSYFEGLIYAPSGALDFNGGAGLGTACTQIIANTVTFTGASDFQSDCSEYDFKDIVLNTLVQLVD